MEFQIEHDETAAAGIRRIAREQLDKALAELADSDLDRHETVHQVRKRCKKLRGLVRLVRPGMEEVYQRENAWYRDSARKLSEVRDAQALVESFDALMESCRATIPADTFAELRQHLLLHRDRSAAPAEDIDRRLEAFEIRIRQGKERIGTWPLEKTGFALVADGLAGTYRRGRVAMKVAGVDPVAANFHEWRKRVKYHWYHARILQGSWEQLLPAYCDELKRLSDLLGDDHDLAVLLDTLESAPEDFGSEEMRRAFAGLARERQATLRTAAHSLGARIYCEKPKRQRNRFRCYWQAWRHAD